MTRRWTLQVAVGLVLAAGLAFPTQAQEQERKPGPVTGPSGPYREQEFLLPWEGRSGQTFLAHAKIFRPEGEEKRPLVLIAHGAPPGGETARQRMSPSWADAPARWFVAQGFVVVVPMRRGYGRSDGPNGEGSGPCDNPDFYNAGLGTAGDTGGVLRHMVKEPYVDSGRLVIVGYSAGGLGFARHRIAKSVWPCGGDQFRRRPGRPRRDCQLHAGEAGRGGVALRGHGAGSVAVALCRERHFFCAGSGAPSVRCLRRRRVGRRIQGNARVRYRGPLSFHPTGRPEPVGSCRDRISVGAEADALAAVYRRHCGRRARPCLECAEPWVERPRGRGAGPVPAS